jgi:hypothetical protein
MRLSASELPKFGTCPYRPSSPIRPGSPHTEGTMNDRDELAKAIREFNNTN